MSIVKPVFALLHLSDRLISYSIIYFEQDIQTALSYPQCFTMNRPFSTLTIVVIFWNKGWLYCMNGLNKLHQWGSALRAHAILPNKSCMIQVNHSYICIRDIFFKNKCHWHQKQTHINYETLPTAKYLVITTYKTQMYLLSLMYTAHTFIHQFLPYHAGLRHTLRSWLSLEYTIEAWVVIWCRVGTVCWHSDWHTG